MQRSRSRPDQETDFSSFRRGTRSAEPGAALAMAALSGAGMLLLRLAEARAYEQVDAAPPGVRVTLTSEVSNSNEAARRLFEREGYTQVRHFWRLIVEMEDDPCESSKEFYQHGKLKIDLVGDGPNMRGTGTYVARQYDIYEKELRTSAGQPTKTMPSEAMAVA